MMDQTQVIEDLCQALHTGLLGITLVDTHPNLGPILHKDTLLRVTQIRVIPHKATPNKVILHKVIPHNMDTHLQAIRVNLLMGGMDLAWVQC